MIYIKETFPNDNIAVIQVDGILDEDSLLILEEVCHRHLGKKKRVELDLHGLIHVSREGRNFLQEVENEGIIVNLPQLLKLPE